MERMSLKEAKKGAELRTSVAWTLVTAEVGREGAAANMTFQRTAYGEWKDLWTMVKFLA